MKILIIGGLGFIGTNLFKELKKRNYQITILDNYTIKNNLKFIKCKIIKNNLSDINKLKKIFINYDVILNLASQTGVIESLNKPIYSVKNNIITYANILESLKTSKCKVFMNASTAGAIYGNTSKISNEKSPTLPVSIYGLTKKFNEDYSKILSKNLKCRIIHLRFSNVFGPYSIHKKSLIHNSIIRALSNDVISIFGNGKQVRNFIFVEDLTKIIIKLFKAKSGTYNISSPKSNSINHYLKILNNINPNIKIKKRKFNDGEVKEVYVSNLKVMKELKLKKFHFTKFEDAIKKTFDWYQKNLN